MSDIEDAVCRKIQIRALVGENKYGTTMEREDLGYIDWLLHLQEELMDAAVYVEKLIEIYRNEGDIIERIGQAISIAEQLIEGDAIIYTEEE